MSGLQKASTEKSSGGDIASSFRSRNFSVRAQLKNEFDSSQVLSPRRLLATFLEQSVDPKAGDLNISSLEDSLPLSEVVQAWPQEKRKRLERQFGKEFLSLIFSLAQEPDNEMFLEGFLDLAGRFEKSDRLNEAALAYSLVAQASNASSKTDKFPEMRERAQGRLDALSGRGPTGARIEFLASRFLHDALDYRSFLPMLAGTAVFSALRATALSRFAACGADAWYARGISARAIAGGFGFLGEFSTFSLLGRGLRDLSGEQVAWDAESVGKDLLGAALSLGALKVFGWAGEQSFLKLHQLPELGAAWRLQGLERFSHAMIPQASMFLGLLASRGLEEKVGLRAPLDGGTLFTDTLSSMLSLGIGAQVGNGMMGRKWAQFQTELGIRTKIFTEEGPRPPNSFLKSWGEKFRDPAEGLPPGFQWAMAVISGEKVRTVDLIAEKPEPMRMDQSHSLELRLSQKLELRHGLSLGDLHSSWRRIYDTAEKRQYQKHGLDFEYAVVRRKDFPYMLHIGSAGLSFDGMRFVMEDFFLDPAINAETRKKMVELIAVHEYGESIFYDHHQASLLEFAVAKNEGILEHYLETLHSKYFLKFRDVAMHRMGKELESALEEKGLNLEIPMEKDGPPDSKDPSHLSALQLRDGFRWPAGLRNHFANALDEDFELARERVRDWASQLVVNEQVRAYLDRALEQAYRAGLEAMTEQKPLDDTLVAVESAFYRELHPLYREIENGVLDENLFQEDILGPALAETHEKLRDKLLASAVTRPDEPRKTAARKGIEELGLFKRDLDGHLDCLKPIDEALEPFMWEEENGDPSPPTKRRAILHQAFWGLVGHLRKEGRQDAVLQEATSFWKKFADLPDLFHSIIQGIPHRPGEYRSIYQEALGLSLRRSFRIHGHDFKDWNVVPLQKVLDAVAQTHWLDVEPEGGVEAPLLDVSHLREAFGNRLENMPGPHHKEEGRWLDTSLQMRRYDHLREEYQERLVSELILDNREFGVDGVATLEDAKSRGAPPALLADLITELWERKSPFEEDWDLAPFFTWLRQAQPEGEAALRGYYQLKLLKDPLLRFAAQNQAILSRLANNLPEFDRLTIPLPAKMGFPVMNGDLGIGGDLILPLLEGLARNPLSELEADWERDWRERHGSASKLLQEGARLLKTRRIFSDTWETNSRWLQSPETDEAFQDMLRIESTKDLLVYLQHGPDSRGNPLGAGTEAWVNAWDRNRRQAWRAWIKGNKIRGLIEDSSPTPLADLRKIANESGLPLGLIAEYYRRLVRASSPNSAIRAGETVDRQTLDPKVVSLFRGFPDPRIADDANYKLGLKPSPQWVEDKATRESLVAQQKSAFEVAKQRLNRASGRLEIQSVIEASLPSLKPMEAVALLLDGLEQIDGFTVSPENPAFIFSNLKALASRVESGERPQLEKKFGNMLSHRHRERRVQVLKVIETYFDRVHERRGPGYVHAGYVSDYLHLVDGARKDPSTVVSKAANKLWEKMIRDWPPEALASFLASNQK